MFRSQLIEDVPRKPTRHHQLSKSWPFTFSRFARSVAQVAPAYKVKLQIQNSKFHRKSFSNSEGSRAGYQTLEDKSEKSLSSEKEEFEGIVQADFAFFDPKTDDFHGVKVLLQTYIDDKQWDLSGFVDLILGQTTEHTCINEIKDFLLKQCKEKDVLDNLRSFLGVQVQNVGLLVSQRVVNLPPQLLPPLYDALFSEVSWATKDEPTAELRKSFCFKYSLLVTRIYEHKNAYQKEGEHSSSEEATIYNKPEDEIFHQLSSWSFRFPLRTQQLSTHEPNDGAAAGEQGENCEINYNGENGQNLGEQETGQPLNPVEGQQCRAAQGQGVQQYSMLDWTRDLLERGQYEPHDTAGDITKNIKMEVPDLEGRVDPTSSVIGLLQSRSILTGTICWMNGDVEHAFQVALDIEEYLSYSTTKKFSSQAKPAYSQPPNRTNLLKASPYFTTDSKNKGIVTAKSNGRDKNKDEDQTPEQGQLQECVDEGYEFNYGEEKFDDLGEEEDDASFLNVVRRILAAPVVEEEDWRRLRYGNQPKKLVIEGGSSQMKKYEISKPKSVVETRKKPLHILSNKKFEVETKESEIIYAVVARELKQSAAVPELKRPLED
ncbi:CDK inhibitor P21 binding protein [Actinidia rufa]|uniref:CDK inhibitor P21 binding protein n=1 Tax=Actinidia rufa TaxID=165716 RepID=A0A7J0FCH3_9ERIC|nr:CDK inhibitor P21 binding protein [Actinidia rufa]